MTTDGIWRTWAPPRPGSWPGVTVALDGGFSGADVPRRSVESSEPEWRLAGWGRAWGSSRDLSVQLSWGLEVSKGRRGWCGRAALLSSGAGEGTLGTDGHSAVTARGQDSKRDGGNRGQEREGGDESPGNALEPASRLSSLEGDGEDVGKGNAGLWDGDGSRACGPPRPALGRPRCPGAEQRSQPGPGQRGLLLSPHVARAHLRNGPLGPWPGREGPGLLGNSREGVKLGALKPWLGRRFRGGDRNSSKGLSRSLLAGVSTEASFFLIRRGWSIF